MLRLLAHIVLELLANAVGLLVAAALLDGFSIDAVSFIIVIAIYTGLKFVLGPLVFKLSIQYLPAFKGGIALVTTFVGLFITNLITDGLSISGLSTWVVATLIVWLFGVIASLVLPLFIFKEVISDKKKDSDETAS